MDILPMVHFAFLAVWVGIIATEGVIELAPRFKRELHRPAIVFHYWIDLLVELPVIVGIVSTGIALCFFIEAGYPFPSTKPCDQRCTHTSENCA